MKSLRFVLPVMFVGAWGVAVGCDDTRPVVDVGVGGMPDDGEGGQATAGEAPAEGGTGAIPIGGAGGTSGGTGGAPECPVDLFEAEGEDCSDFGEGFICSDGGTDPCQFGNSIRCSNGVWERQEAFPAPCGGAGGAGTGGAEGQLGGAGGQGGA